jgi:hypothetical protein
MRDADLFREPNHERLIIVGAVRRHIVSAGDKRT